MHSSLAVKEAKDFPNVLLILSSDHFGLIKAFNRYANVFVHFVDPCSFTHVMHRFPGRLKAECKRIPEPLLKFTAKFFNPPHRVGIRQLDPEMIDLVFVSDPVTCKIDLKPFRNAVKAYWSQDCIYPSTFQTQILSTRIQDYDIVFCAHRDYLTIFSKMGLKVCWLPFAYYPDVCRPMAIPEKYDLTFIGTMTDKRMKIIESLKMFLPQSSIFVGNVYQHEMVRKYNESKIVLNISRIGELNWRVFEVLGCKRLLLTDRSQEVGELFHNGEHLVMYDSVEDLVDKIEKYLANSEEREKIALQGFKEVAQKHTIYHRVEEVLRTTGVDIC